MTMNPPVWTTACPDWEKRIVQKKSWWCFKKYAARKTGKNLIQ